MLRVALIFAFACASPLAIAAEPPANASSFEIAPGWTLTQIGLVEQKQRFTDPLMASFASGIFTLQANAGMLFFKRQDDPDGVGFVYRTLEGDGAITAKITRFDQFHHWGGAGVMIRDGLKPLDRFLCAMLEAKGRPKPVAGEPAPPVGTHIGQVASTRFRREVSSDGLGSLRPDEVQLPIWLRVQRQGNKFTSAYSTDGEKWKDIKTVEFEAGPKLLAGVTAWNRGGKTLIGAAEFVNVTVESAKR